VHNTRKGHYAIRHGRWLLVGAKSGAITKAPRWFDEENGYERNPNDAALFDLDSDLGQRHNLVTEYPERVTKLRALLERIRQQGSAPRLLHRGS
jgi:arylsulfatase A